MPTRLQLVVGLLILALPAAAQPAAPERQKVGTFVTGLHALDVARGTFGATFWLWAAGPDSARVLHTADYVNAEATTVRLESTVSAGPGRSWSQQRVTGTFREHFAIVLNMRAASAALGSEHGLTLIDGLHVAGLVYVVTIAAATVAVRRRQERLDAGKGGDGAALARFDHRPSDLRRGGGGLRAGECGDAAGGGDLTMRVGWRVLPATLATGGAAPGDAAAPLADAASALFRRVAAMTVTSWARRRQRPITR